MIEHCPHDPKPLLGLPLGMYHCPDCGMMVLAGMPHPPRDPSMEGSCNICHIPWLDCKCPASFYNNTTTTNSALKENPDEPPRHNNSRGGRDKPLELC